MEHLSVIFEKGSSKVSSKKTYNEYQKFCTCRRIRYLWSVTLKRLVNDARCRIIHTRPTITSWKKLSGLSNSLVGVRRNGGMAEWRKNCLQILEDGMAEDCPKSLRWNSGKLPEILNDRTINSSRRSHGSKQTLASECPFSTQPSPPHPKI